MKLAPDFDSGSLLSGMRQATDASAQAAQQMRDQFRAATQQIDAGIRQQLANEIRARQQNSVEVQKITAVTVRDQGQQWNSVFTGVNRGFTNSITTMTNSSRTLQQNIARVLDQILADFLRMLERMVERWVAQHLFMQVFGIGSQKATSAASIGSSAAEGGAAAYASAAAIPVVGWSIAPAVAADAYSNILGFEALNAFAAGGIVPDDSLAFVHKNEMVLPASLSSGLSQMIGAGEDGGGNHLHVNFSVAATDSQSFEGRLHQHADALVQVIKRAWRHGKF
jgi:AcrR family transcriptional regulator